MKSGRVIGFFLLGVAALGWLLAAAFLGVQVMTREVTLPGAFLGVFLVTLCFAVPVAGAGIFLVVRGKAEEQAFARARMERELLNMVLTQGKVSFSEAAITLNVSREEVESLVRSLVGKQLFSGAVHWEKGLLYSREAAALYTERRCPNCGGELEIAGKGVLVCPWCGAEIFLHREQSATPGKDEPAGGSP